MNHRLIKRSIQKRLFVFALTSLGYAMIQYNAVRFIGNIYNLYQPKEVKIPEIFISVIWGLVPAIFLPLRTSPSATTAWVYYALIYLSAAAVGVTVHE